MPTSLAADYFKHITNERVQRSKITCALAIFFFVIGGGILDYFVYKDAFFELCKIRIATSILLISIYFFYKHFAKPEHITLYIEILWPIIISASICYMIFKLDGAQSPYHAGLNATLLGAMLLFLLTLRGTLWIVIITMSLYFLAIYPTIHTVDKSILFSNFYFLLLTGTVAAFASFINEKRRYTEFTLRHQLNQRNMELAEIDRMKTNFFANISHELRTPLTLILSPVEDLLQSEQPLDFRVKQLLSTVQNSSYRLLKLVNDLLSIARLDEHDKELECIPVDLQPLLRGIVTSMQHIADKQKITLQIRSDFTPVIINANVNALEKIFINLINNAIKFTPQQGEIHINNTVTTEEVTITIQDTGIGISKKDLPHIFERFQQADSSATRRYQGTGLGLALVRELTIAQKGNVQVESQLDKGTLFTLTFPVYSENTSSDIKSADTLIDLDSESPLEEIHQKAEYTLQLNRPDTSILEPTPSSSTTGGSIDDRSNLLIIEDEPDLRTYLVNTLSEDYRVFSAADGLTGLALAQKHKPDLVLTDLMLPKMDGLALCSEIKNNSALNFTKVILLTARIDEQSKLTALENGADDFLTKPFSSTEIKTRLRNLAASLQLEKDLQIHNEELTTALSDLKAAESKLLHSEKLNAIGSLAAGLLHEVNNPLNYTLTAAQILKRDPSIKQDEDKAEMVDDILEGMERIKDIVKDLHTFAYPDEVDKESVFVFADAIRTALRFTSSQKGLTTINVNVPDNLEVIGSISHIVQVLVNLMTNALKATKDSEDPTITISCQFINDNTDDNDNAINDSNRRVLLSVEDNGVGIDDKSLSRIFDPFFTTRDVGEGLGMGLSICHTIIENHGGSINVESKAGEFTRFSFDLAVANHSGEL